MFYVLVYLVKFDWLLLLMFKEIFDVDVFRYCVEKTSMKLHVCRVLVNVIFFFSA